MTTEDPNANPTLARIRQLADEMPRQWSLSPLRDCHMDQQPWVSVPPGLVQTVGDANAGLLLAWIPTGGNWPKNQSCGAGVRNFS